MIIKMAAAVKDTRVDPSLGGHFGNALDTRVLLIRAPRRYTGRLSTSLPLPGERAQWTPANGKACCVMQALAALPINKSPLYATFERSSEKINSLFSIP